MKIFSLHFILQEHIISSKKIYLEQRSKPVKTAIAFVNTPSANSHRRSVRCCCLSDALYGVLFHLHRTSLFLVIRLYLSVLFLCVFVKCDLISHIGDSLWDEYYPIHTFQCEQFHFKITYWIVLWNNVVVCN